MKKRKLETVTLLGVDCVDIDRLVLAADICRERFEFAEVKLLTSLPAKHHTNVVPISPLNSTEAYSHFAIAELDKYVNTEHVMIIQYDGFILNPDAWTDEFLTYDYIGAPWLVQEWSVKDFAFPKETLGTMIVGNGGFSLRSKKFTSLCARLSQQNVFEEYQPEDVVLCVRKRKLLENAGMRFAPVALAKKFSFESLTDEHEAWDGQFGFHGIRWTDITKWATAHPEYTVDPVANSIVKEAQYVEIK